MEVPSDNPNEHVRLKQIPIGFLRNDGRLDENTASSACISKALGPLTLWLQSRGSLITLRAFANCSLGLGLPELITSITQGTLNAESVG